VAGRFLWRQLSGAAIVRVDFAENKQFVNFLLGEQIAEARLDETALVA
jgi:hypothetical protein